MNKWKTRSSGANVSESTMHKAMLVPARVITGTALFLLVAINYLDRTNLSVALPFIKEEFGLTATEQGLLLSAFSWAYIVLQLPGGWLTDKIGPKLSIFFGLVGWSIVTAGTALVSGFGSLLGARALVGAFEAPAFPAANVMVAAWFPSTERARATAGYTAGQHIGSAFGVPALSLLAVTFGWHSVFIVTGVAGVLFSIFWFWWVSDGPQSNRFVRQAELDYITNDLDMADRTVKQKVTWSDFWFLLRQRRLWGLYIGQFANNCVLYFFLTWFPTYLVDGKGFDFIKAGFAASIPWLAALVGVTFGGWWSDKLLKSGRSRTFARKTPVMTGFVLATAIVAANYVNSPAVVIAVLAVATFANGLTSLGWTLVADIAPTRLLGLTGGIKNFVSNIGGIVTPIGIGIVVDRTGSFELGLLMIGGVVVIGLLSYAFLIDKVERINA